MISLTVKDLTQNHSIIFYGLVIGRSSLDISEFLQSIFLGNKNLGSFVIKLLCLWKICWIYWKFQSHLVINPSQNIWCKVKKYSKIGLQKKTSEM